MLTKEQIIRSAEVAVFGRPLVMIVYRGVIAEAIVAAALSDWEWCSSDYFEHDFIHPQGTRLEVKQTALKQTWETVGMPRPTWDIAARKAVWRDNKWMPAPGRNADIYVLCLHDVTDNTADHRDPGQWKFFAVRAAALP